MIDWVVRLAMRFTGADATWRKGAKGAAWTCLGGCRSEARSWRRSQKVKQELGAASCLFLGRKLLFAAVSS